MMGAMQAVFERKSQRNQIMLIVTGYAAVTMFAVAEFFQRYLYSLREPVDSAGGMAAFGDLMLSVFVFFLFLFPTFFLLRLLAQNQAFYGPYAKVLLAVSVTNPISVVLLAVFHRSVLAQNVFGERVWVSPLVLTVMLMSRCIGRRSPSKKLMTWASLIEGGTLVVSFALFVVLAH
jgi:hypothetical protein